MTADEILLYPGSAAGLICHLTDCVDERPSRACSTPRPGHPTRDEDG